MIKSIVDRIADRIRWGYLAAFIILLISYIVSFVSTQKLMKQSQLVNHSSEVIHGLDNVVGFVTRCESAARGYIITDRPELLSRYLASRNNADSALQSIKNLTADNPAQQVNMDSLHILVHDKINWLDHILAIFDATHTITQPILNPRNEGLEKMNRVENYVHYAQDQERKLWEQRTIELAKYSNVIKIFTIISLIVAILLTFYSIVTFNKENKAKREADKKAITYRNQLEMRIDELAALNLELVELRNIEKFAVTGRISRTIAHEVRNPLTNINLATEQLKNEISENEDASLLFDMISRNSNRINQLISDLLNSTRTSELSYVKASINDIIDRSLEFAIDRIELKHIYVVKDYDPDICSVLVDEEKIVIAFLNIIVNAIESMEDKGTLNISTEHKNSRCVVKITDSGKGLNKEDLSRLFEPYFTTKEKGTGLGLTNTQNIILAHNANINVESEPGKGTTFTISFNFA
ncbi:MAG: CHASE3 domain-containing protein [Bacteroidota bacterium]|nr:CHASE3 domain-containing protein [Bacteroidota bacterium]